MEGYYNKESSGKELAVPTGRLSINVTNLPEFRGLIQTAKRQVDQLQQTVNWLSNFELHIDFSSDSNDTT